MSRAGIKVSGLVASGKVAARENEEQRKPLVSARPTAAPSVVELPTRDELPAGADSSAASNESRTLGGRENARKIPVAEIVDSPYQPRLKYDPEEIDRLAETMDTAEHAEPVRVRIVNGKYELISGHRRIRAARSLGWPEINAYVEELTDREAQAKTLLLAVGSVGLSDYEYALMFATAVKDGLCKTQREVASYFGQGTTKVNGCLEMLKLPAKIVRMLDAKPDLFGYQTGAVIKKLCAEYPNNLADIERGVQRLVEGAAQNSLKSWVLQAIKGQAERTASEPNLITNGRRLIFTTKINVDQRSVIVNCKVPDLDIAAFEKHLQAWLEVQAKEISSSAADETDGASS
jgi:ParB family chromosome partitioning protein